MITLVPCRVDQQQMFEIRIERISLKPRRVVHQRPRSAQFLDKDPPSERSFSVWICLFFDLTSVNLLNNIILNRATKLMALIRMFLVRFRWLISAV